MKKQTQPKAKAPDETSAVAPPPKTEPAETKPAAPKTPRLSPSLKAQADRVIAARDKKQAPVTREPRPPKAKDTDGEGDLVVFAFRLSAEERELIHKAAGPAKASRFVRALAVAAACHDEGAIKLLLESAKATA
jgi:hypothetical protein